MICKQKSDFGQGLNEPFQCKPLKRFTFKQFHNLENGAKKA